MTDALAYDKVPRWNSVAHTALVGRAVSTARAQARPFLARAGWRAVGVWDGVDLLRAFTRQIDIRNR